ncbi:hypothetical protein GCM10023171_22320 [Microbacterium panaciterrae]|uniref:MobA-like NTP transferase domain-containing protein n=1 Tax=Microbacterium panaciterrae TaxID=985759 RepID=A0ABP8PGU7_9MICO
MLAGASLLARTVTALAGAGAAPVVAVGPRLDDSEVVWVREDPPFGGPVAALAAAFARDELANTEWLLLLAGDLVRPEAVVAGLCGSLPAAEGLAEASEAIVFRADGHPQWLAGIYRATAVRAALATLGDPAAASCRALLGGLAIRWIEDQDGITADVDTPADLHRARADRTRADRAAAENEETS